MIQPPDSRPLGQPPEENVLAHGQFRHQAQFLIHRGNPLPKSLARAAQPHRPAVDDNLSSRRLHGPGENLYQRALAGPVLSHQGVNLPPANCNDTPASAVVPG